jgi:hypothetical protein
VVQPYLLMHGLQFRVLKNALRDIRVESMRVQEDDVVYEPRPFQGRTRTQVQGRWQPDVMSLRPGSLFVPLDQPHALLVAHLLEPSAPDSLSSWGMFNTAYELSDMVAGHRELELARWMFEQHPIIKTMFGDALFQQLPQWRQTFQERISNDEGFATDPRARLDFWMSKLPPYDPTYNLYPILRLASTPP